MKYSKIAGAVTWSGGVNMLHVGMSADDDHPLVKERPTLWTSKAPTADLQTPSAPAPVEDTEDLDEDTEDLDDVEDLDEDLDPEPKEPEVIERATRGPGELSQARDTSRPAPTKAARAKAKAEAEADKDK